MPSIAVALPLAVEAPRELWAALMMLAFLAISVLTMWLARIPTRQAPPPLLPKEDETDGASGPDEGEQTPE